MQSETSGPDPTDIWQQQSQEEYKMSLYLLRLRAQQLASNIRWQFFKVSGVALALVLFDCWNFGIGRHSLQRAGFMLAGAWALYALYAARQTLWPRTLPEDAGLQTCLAFSRNERRRERKKLSREMADLNGLERNSG